MGIEKDVLETEVRLSANKALAELKQLESETSNLRRTQERLKKQRDGLITLGKKETEEYKKVTQALRDTNKQVKSNEDRMKALRSTIGVTAMSMRDLRKRASELKRDLNNTSKAANPKEYARLEKELGQVGQQMNHISV